jgi:mono/diheme cytochrome c family protein
MNAYEWAELAGEKEGEITTLRERLAECEKLLADIDEYGKIDAWDMSEIRARIGALLYRRTDSASACPACHGTGKRIAPNKDGPPLWVACECGAVTVSEVTK